MSSLPIDADAVTAIVGCLTGFVIGAFGGILVHESGHALACMAVGLEPRAIVIGRGPLIWRHRIVRTWLVVRAVPTYGSAAHLSETRGRRDAQALVVAAGPFASLLLAAVAAISMARALQSDSLALSEIFMAVAVVASAQGLAALWPRTYKVKGLRGTRQTDGLKLLKLARGEDIHNFEARYRTLLRSALNEAEASAPPSHFAPELLYQIGRSDKAETWAREDMANVLARLIQEPDLSQAERLFILRRYKLDSRENTSG